MIGLAFCWDAWSVEGMCLDTRVPRLLACRASMKTSGDEKTSPYRYGIPSGRCFLLWWRRQEECYIIDYCSPPVP